MIYFCKSPLTPARWQKTNSPWCYDSKVSSFVINKPKLAELEKIDLANNSLFLAELQSFSQKLNLFETAFNIFSSPLSRRAFSLIFSEAALVAYGPPENLIVCGLLVLEKCQDFSCPFPHTNPVFCTLCWELIFF